MRRSFLCAVALLLALPVSAMQVAAATDLQSLAADAGIIVVGTVGSASPDGSRALIQVSEYYKRGLPQYSVQVVPDCTDNAAACLATQAQYTAGQQVVLFLQQNAAGWTTVRGKDGEYLVSGGHVLSSSGADAGSLDAFKAQLVQLTGERAGAAPGFDPTPETTAPQDVPNVMPLLYLAAILTGAAGLAVMAVLVRHERRKS